MDANLPSGEIVIINGRHWWIDNGKLIRRLTSDEIEMFYRGKQDGTWKLEFARHGMNDPIKK